MTTAEAGGHILAATLAGVMFLYGGWLVPVGLVLLFVWILASSRP